MRTSLLTVSSKGTPIFVEFPTTGARGTLRITKTALHGRRNHSYAYDGAYGLKTEGARPCDQTPRFTYGGP